MKRSTDEQGVHPAEQTVAKAKLIQPSQVKATIDEVAVSNILAQLPSHLRCMRVVVERLT